MSFFVGVAKVIIDLGDKEHPPPSSSTPIFTTTYTSPEKLLSSPVCKRRRLLTQKDQQQVSYQKNFVLMILQLWRRDFTWIQHSSVDKIVLECTLL